MPYREDVNLRWKDGLVLCSNCDTPASWEHSVEVGWIGCGPCITGEASSFDSEDLIAYESNALKAFFEEFNS